jgi:hypothetical protein
MSETEKTRNDYAIELGHMSSEERTAAQTPAFHENARGFATWTFCDRGGVPCRIVKSSHVASDLDDEGIWFFSEDGNVLLTVAQVEKLLPILQAFAETGELPTNKK